ncbi:Mobile element protein [Candidatus Enterovibrio altilux]|uniref:Mobile element protein n=1 Tax=Candidatus Enterovibrio altilux TaxID=1927128 RepID=A0A291B733_9GAMM|nr:Mobile element protein [Candidatus Enterovibrio luxaltus]
MLKIKNKGTIQHLVINFTGLQIYDKGERKVKKHRTDRPRRVWCKLHLTVDINTHKIIATELSASNVTDSEVLPNFCKQTRQKINEISDNSLYKTNNVTKAFVLGERFYSFHQKNIFWKRSHSRNLDVDYQMLYDSNKFRRMKYFCHKRFS